MLLHRVTYQVFGYESGGPWAIDRAAWHQMDGEVVLTFSTGKRLFVSWGNVPLPYSVEQKENTFFQVGSLTEVDMTQHPYWLPFIEREIELKYFDEDHQVLVVSHQTASLFVSSQYDDGTFCGDCIRVSLANPL